MRTQTIVFCFFVSLTCVFCTPTSKSVRRIIGGDDVPIEEVPYQISLQIEGRHHCGGSIIAPNYVVTAAHCTEFHTEEDLSVRAGTSTRESGGQVVNVKKIYRHPNYNVLPLDSDIAILELTDNLEFSDEIAAIALPSPLQTWPGGTEVLISGWGVTHFMDEYLPENLQAATVEIVDLTTCRSIEGEGITDRMLCAGVDGGGIDSCTDDSGGPLQVDGILAGVVNFGIGCALPNHVGVYANVSALRDFIEDVTGL